MAGKSTAAEAAPNKSTETASAPAQAEESNSSRALAVVKPTPGPIVVGNVKYSVRQVTRPVLSQKDNVPIFVLFDGAIVQAEERRGRNTDKDDDDRLPPYIAPITNLETGELMTIVVNAVLKGELEEKYKDGGYIGKAFRLVSDLVAMQGRSGQRLRVYNIQELVPEV